MAPKKKKAEGGDASKGERVFKNLCAVCHSLSVSDLLKLVYKFKTVINKCIYSPTQQALLLEA